MKTTRTRFGGLAALLISLALGGCGGGGGEAPVPGNVSAAQIAGQWDVAELIDDTACGGQGDTDNYPVVVTQNGNSITVAAPGGTFQGEINGNTLSWGGQYADDGGWVTITSMTLRLNGRTFSGSASWQFRDTRTGPVVCSGTTNVTATLVQADLSAPTNLTVDPVGPDQVDLAWSDNTRAEQAYRVERSEFPATGFVLIASLPADTTRYQDTGVQAATTYYYRVAAAAGSDQSDYSNVAPVTTPAGTSPGPVTTPPAAPSGLVVDGNSSTSVFLSWLDNADNESGYLIERRGGGLASFTSIATLPAESIEYEDTGLNPQTNYEYRVTAFNAAGQSNPASGQASTQAPPAGAPPAPTDLNGTANGTTGATLTWTDTASNELQYVVERSGFPTGPFAEVAVLPADAVVHNDTGLSAATVYYYRVRSRNATGDSDPSNIVAVATDSPPLLPPAAPGNLAVSSAASDRLELSWTDNADNETGFIVERAGAAFGPFSAIATLGPDSTGFTDTALQASTSYFYRVAASNAAGPSDYSATAGATTQAPPVIELSAPSGLTATATSDTSIRLNWADNSSTESGFAVLRGTQLQGNGLTQVGSEPVYVEIARLPAGSTSYTDTGLSPSTRYDYQVFAFNAAGDSPWSGPASATTDAPPPVPPAAPSNLNASAASSSRIDLSWFDNASDETGYRIERRVPGGVFGLIAETPANAVSFADTGLSGSTTYIYRIAAINAAGQSDFAPEASATTDAVSLSGPSLSGPAGQVGSSFDLNWSYTWTGLLASTANGYELQESTSSPSSGFTTIFNTVNGNDRRAQVTVSLDNRSVGTYYYRVRARENTAFTDYSNVVTVQVVNLVQTAELTPVDDTLIIIQSNDASQQQVAHPNTFLNVGCDFVSGGFFSDFLCQASFIRFDTGFLAGRTVLSAVLRLYPEILPATLDDLYRVRPVASAWNEATLTYDAWNSNGLIYTGLEVFFELPVTTVIPVELDVTAIVQGWANGNLDNWGFVVDNTNFTGLNTNQLRSTVFCSMECSPSQGTPPQLEIVYQ